MKKQLLMWGFALFGGITASAQSPYKGTTVPEKLDATADVYLYNVGTGKWLQNNDDNDDKSYDGGMWTTRGELGKRGFDIQLRCIEEDPANGNGFQINPKFGHNHSMNGDNFYLDTEAGVTTWYFEPAPEEEVNGVSNAYRICANMGTSYPYLGGDEKGWLVKGEDDNAPVHDIWQVVTKEERLQYMIDHASPENGMDATWLIADPTFANQNERHNQWSYKMERPGPGDIVHIGQWLGTGGDRDIHANRVLECWSSWSMSAEQTIKDIPNGTYKLGLQGFYREGAAEPRGDMRENDEYAYNIWSEGREHHYAKYFANGVTNDLMSVFACAQDEREDNGFFYNARMVDPEYGDVMESGKWVPNSGESASWILFYHRDLYQNEPVTTSVADGTLTFGVKKDEGVNDDWVIMDNFTLTYYGSQIDINIVKEGLIKAISAAEALKERSTKALNDKYTEAIATGKALVSVSDDATAIAAATTAINEVVAAIKATSYNANLLIQTVNLCRNEGITGDDMDLVAYASEYADNVDDVNRALDGARMLRRQFHADRHPNVFRGNVPEDGRSYYLYNVGTGRFFCGGESWGTHGAVGFPGVYVTLLNNLNGGFCIDTHIQNNGDEHYLDYDGWCDRNPSQEQKDFAFIDQGNGVYCLQRTNISDEEKADGKFLLGYRTDNYDAVDSNKEGFDNPNNQWILVTQEDRDALMADASEDNPVDVTYKIKMPGFNNREYKIYGGWDNSETGAWTSHIGGSIFGWNGDTPNGIFDGYDADYVELSQDIDDLEPGYYVLSVKGYYRDCAHGDYYQKLATGEYVPQQLASLKATTDEGDFSVNLMNIENEVNKAPGFGEYIDGFGWITNHPNHSSDYFRVGLYHNQILVKVGDTGTMTIGIYKEGTRQQGDWVCFDDFRLTYLGENTPTSIDGVTDAKTADDGKIYNIQGVQVKNATQRGVYIKNGKKFVVNK